MKQHLFVAFALFSFNILIGCASNGNKGMSDKDTMAGATQQNNSVKVADGKYLKATFAGGCFWCMQPPFDTVKGVIGTLAGYSGGTEKNPTYEQVSAGTTGHAESVEITYDPSVVSYEHLLDIYWHNIDPTTLNRQFADAGRQYRTAIFYHSEEQKEAAIASMKQLEHTGKFSQPIVVEITEATPFYPAEEYHQEYYKKNYEEYHRYRVGSGREGFLQKLWGTEGK